MSEEAKKQTMEKAVIDQHQNKIMEGLKSVVALKRSGEEVYLNPANWMIMAEALAYLFKNVFGGLFGWGKSTQNGDIILALGQIKANQEELLKVEKERLESTKKIQEHLEKTCLSEEKMKTILNDLSSSITDSVGAEIPNNLQRTKGVMKFGGKEVGEIDFERKV